MAVGQRASVLPDGVSGAIDATVTAVGAAAGTIGFPVVLGLSGTGTGMRAGASAAVTLTTGAVTNATVVPTSALHSFGSRHVVDVMHGSTATPTVVTVGIVGPLRTQVLSGLSVGQRVVLADLSSTVTSDSSTTGAAAGRLAALTFVRGNVRGGGAGPVQVPARPGG